MITIHYLCTVHYIDLRVYITKNILIFKKSTQYMYTIHDSWWRMYDMHDMQIGDARISDEKAHNKAIFNAKFGHDSQVNSGFSCISCA